MPRDEEKRQFAWLMLSDEMERRASHYGTYIGVGDISERLGIPSHPSFSSIYVIGKHLPPPLFSLQKEGGGADKIIWKNLLWEMGCHYSILNKSHEEGGAGYVGKHARRKGRR